MTTLQLSRAIRTIMILAWAIGGGSAIMSWAASPAPSDVEHAIREIVARDAPPDTAYTGAPHEMLERFYGSRSYAPAWTQDGQPTRQAQEAVSLLEHAPEKGLYSADYDAKNLAHELGVLQVRPAPASAQDVAVFDVGLTLALIRYASHLAHGRVNPRSLSLDLEPGERRVDVVALIQRGLESDRLTFEIESAEPQLSIYTGLKTSLAQYRLLAADQSLPLVPTVKSKVTPGDTFAGLPQLTRRLAALGDLNQGAIKRGAGTRYDGEVVAAVKRFQYRHGLAEDGVLGASTIAELNHPLDARVQQIEMGIERARWLPSAPAGRFLVINIPAFKLLGFDGAIGTDRTLLEMDVIVGRAGKTPTPVFVDQIEYLDFSPYWNVPRSIAVKELLPKLHKDPGYLAREGMELVGNGVRTEVDAASLAELEHGTLRLRQRPGTKNALGGVKFIFPNGYDIYLHSTPARQLFSRTRRDFSHGCIRVADPVALAQFVLFDRPDWSAKRIRDSMSLALPVRVNINEPIPIVIFYTTAVVDTEGRTRFLPDIYDHDAKLEQALAASRKTSP